MRTSHVVMMMAIYTINCSRLMYECFRSTFIALARLKTNVMNTSIADATSI